MTSPTNPSPRSLYPLTHCLIGNGLVIFAMLCAYGSTAAAANDSGNDIESHSVEWLSPPPCAPSYAAPLQGQPEIGLGLFRFSCPGQPNRLVSGKQQILVHSMTALRQISRGEPLDQTMLALDDDAQWISRLSDLPLDLRQIGQIQARRSIAPGQRLYAKDFEPRRLWIGGEQITLNIIQGAVTTTVPGQSISMGRMGERSSAKTDSGKIFTGLATLCGSAPCLHVQLADPQP